MQTTGKMFRRVARLLGGARSKRDVKKYDLNDFAVLITLKEGKKVSLTNAQVKEVLLLVGGEMQKDPWWGLALMEAGRKHQDGPKEKGEREDNVEHKETAP